MANSEHLAILRQGPLVWNEWMMRPIKIIPDLANADLREMDLRRYELSGVNLRNSNLSGANLRRTRLVGTFLEGANLRGANLLDANLCWAFLGNVDFQDAELGDTLLCRVDLSSVRGLISCNHLSPSMLDHRTLMNSGELPIEFLRGCGLPDDLIDYLPSLRNDPIQFYSCFISYSSDDEEFAQRLHADLQNNGVRTWFAPEDLKIGDKVRLRLDESIRHYDKLLLILSENSIASNWVEYEAERALDQERKRGGMVLFPVRLDDSIMEVEGTWADHIRDRHIGDFRDWKNHDSYHESLERLLRDLKEEKPPSP